MPMITRTTIATIVSTATTIQKTGTFFRTTETTVRSPAATSNVASPGLSSATMLP